MATHPSTAIFQFDQFEFDAAAGELKHKGTRTRLQEKPAQLLRALVEHPSEVVTRDELRERMWPGGVHVDFEQGLANAIQKLRDVLDDNARDPRFIETLPRRGYRFLVPVQRSGPPAHAPASAAPTPRRKLLVRAWAAGIAMTIATGTGLWAWRSKAAAPSAPAFARVAVLPFENATGENPLDFLADGLTEEVITQLGRMDPERIGVIARSTVMAQKGSGKPAHEAAREIKAQYFVEGSLRRAGDKFRVNARLVRVADQLQIWSSSYDRDAGSFVNDDRQIAASLALSLAGALAGGRPGRVQRAPSLDAQALRSYRIGRFLLDKKTPGGVKQSIALFEDAVSKDAGFALAWAALAEAIHFSGAMGELSPAGAFRRTNEYARRALELDETTGEAFAVLAETNFRFGPNAPEVEGWFRKAIDLTPESSTARHWYGNYLGIAGRAAEGIAHLERAAAMDPLELHIRADLAGWYYEAGQHKRAEGDLLQLIALKPAFPKPHFVLAQVRIREKRWDEAIAGLRKAIELSPETPKYVASLVQAQLDAGRPASAAQTLRDLREMARRRHFEPAELASLQSKVAEASRRARGGA